MEIKKKSNTNWKIYLHDYEYNHMDMQYVKKIVLEWVLKNRVYEGSYTLSLESNLTNLKIIDGEGLENIINLFESMGKSKFFKYNIEYERDDNIFIPELIVTIESIPSNKEDNIESKIINIIGG